MSRPIDADKRIRAATAGVVTAVAAFAAVVSFSHIYKVAVSHGQSGTDARILPLSVDGLILAASLVLLHEARNSREAPRFAYAMLCLGVAATVAANVAYGLPFGIVGAAISAWPAVAFVGAVEMMMLMVRRARHVASLPAADVVTPAVVSPAGVTPEPAVSPPAGTTADAPGVVTPEPAPARQARPRRAATKAARQPAPATTPQRAEADRILAREPDITHAELGRRVGVTERTVQRWRSGGKDDTDTDTGDSDSPEASHRLSVVHDIAGAR